MSARTPRELRLALSMNGGVSLAVWIGGAVSEIDCLRRGEGFWGDLLEACGFKREALVDVMTGASAGGLNAVLMAQAIRSRTPFVEFLPLWQDHADIDSLLKGPRHATKYDARAVLKGAYFTRSLREALDKPVSETPITQNLAVFASATLVRANPIEFKDVPGAPIAETRSDAYFHVTRRGPSRRGLDGFEPSDLVMDNVPALALVGRATSSLPGLFEPVKFRRATFGSRLVGGFTRLRDEVEVMDGGVIDNVPISRAIRAIASSPTECRVRRVLLYLHPDPGGRPGPRADEDPGSALKVVQSFFGKRRETIREDIELLRQHNDAVERRQQEGAALLRSFAASGYHIDVAARAQLAQSICSAMLLRAAIDPPSELAWHAPNVQRLVPLVDGPDDPSKAELARDILATVSSPDVLVAVPVRRVALGLQRIIGLIGPNAVEIDFDEIQPRLYELLLLCDVITSYQVARFLGHGAGSAPTTRLTASRDELDEIRVGDSLDDETWRALASWDLSAATPSTGGHTLRQHLELIVQRIVADCPVPTDDLRSPAADVLRSLKSGATTPDDLDLALLPLAAESVASDQPIEFVRIAGNVESPASVEFDKLAPRGQRKIAGLQLHHLGAFFARDWRTNDWWWGRLDSVKALLDVVLDREAIQALRDSGYLAANGFTTEAHSIDDIKNWLVERRQLQLLDEHCGQQQPDFETATSSDEFTAWATADRRLSAMLGSKALTSTAIRGVITSSKMLRRGLGKVAQVALTVFRPLLLALAGVALAGRRAAAATAWTLCVLAAVRAKSTTDSWLIWAIGVIAFSGIVALVELKIRPARSNVWDMRPYAYAVVGAVVGGVAIANKVSLFPDDPTQVGWKWWIIPPIAAGISAAMLFFWMRWWAAALLTSVTAALYFLFAYAAVRDAAGDSLVFWPSWWMFHSMWVCWLISVLGLPIAIGFMPDSMLRPVAFTSNPTDSIDTNEDDNADD